MASRTGKVLVLLALVIFCLFSLTLFSQFTTYSKSSECALPRGHSTASVNVFHQNNTKVIREQSEGTYRDGIRFYHQETHETTPDILFLVLTGDSLSWGSDTWSPTRTFQDFLDLLNSTELDLSRVSLGMMTASLEEFELYQQAVPYSRLAEVTILLKEKSSEDSNFWTSIPREGRHSRSYQTARRRAIAKLRNELMFRTLHEEEHVIWVDADIKEFSPGLVQTMLQHSIDNADAGIITALAEHPWFPDYDKNAFAGGRPGPKSSRLADPALAEEELQSQPSFVGQLVQNTTDSDIIPLDSVGGTILYMRAGLIRQGLTFPPYYVIGTRWGHDGWDGIETQGVCYAARSLDGGGCYTLGGSHKVKHTGH